VTRVRFKCAFHRLNQTSPSFVGEAWIGLETHRRAAILLDTARIGRMGLIGNAYSSTRVAKQTEHAFRRIHSLNKHHPLRLVRPGMASFVTGGCAFLPSSL